MAAMMITPKRHAPMSLNVFAYGPLSSTLPFALPTGPKLSDATQKNENANQTQKVDVGRDALGAEPQLEREELPELHERVSSAGRRQLRACRERLRKYTSSSPDGTARKPAPGWDGANTRISCCPADQMTC